MVLLPPCNPEQCGKDFRASLKKPSPNYPYGFKAKKPRIVPAFTIQAMQRNTKVRPPPKSTVYEPLPAKPTLFRKCYKRGEFPIAIEFTNAGRMLAWKVPIEKLDFHHYLPMFFDGLAEISYPYTYIVEKGINDLIQKGSYKVLPVVPQLIIPLKNALATKRPVVLCHTLQCIQMLVTRCDRVGEALVPYYRQILPMFNLFKERNFLGFFQNAGDVEVTDSRGRQLTEPTFTTKRKVKFKFKTMPQNHDEKKEKKRLAERKRMQKTRKDPDKYALWKLKMKETYLKRKRDDNIGEGIDHTTSRGENVADLIEETLQILERYGGPDAFINIKYVVPTYESCVQN